MKAIIKTFGSLSIVFCLALAAFGQEGSVAQRLDVMRQKLETIKRSAASAASVLKDESKNAGKGEEKDNADSPLNRSRSRPWQRFRSRLP